MPLGLHQLPGSTTLRCYMNGKLCKLTQHLFPLTETHAAQVMDGWLQQTVISACDVLRSGSEASAQQTYVPVRLPAAMLTALNCSGNTAPATFDLLGADH